MHEVDVRADVTPAGARGPVIGFDGLGVMGKPMAANLLGAGFEVVVHNRTRAAERDLIDLGTSSAERLDSLAAWTDIVITMLSDDAAVESVLDGAAGLVELVPKGTLLIDMSTVSPAQSRALAKRAADRGVSFLDAPVSGGDVGAREGTLSIMVGGAAEDVDRARPLFDVLEQEEAMR